MLPTPVLQAAYRMRFLLSNNASTILTGTGIAGTVTTAVLTARSTFKAASAIGRHEAETILRHGEESEPGEVVDVDKIDYELSTFEKVKLIWPYYIPPAITGITTIMAIFYAHRVDAKKIAALIAATSVSEKALIDYKEKVVEKLTKAQATKVHDEIVQGRVDGSPPSGDLIVIDGKVLCMDVLTGRYFQSTMEDINKAVNETNHSILNHADLGASLSELHDRMGLPATPYTEIVGWGPDNLIQAVFSTATAPGGIPCLTVDFNFPPIANYQQLH